MPADFHHRAYIYHYTYGIEYTLAGDPQAHRDHAEITPRSRRDCTRRAVVRPLPRSITCPPQGIYQIGEWSLDKRHYGSDHPPRALRPPPPRANAAAFWLTNAWNDASANIENWPRSKSMGTIGWRRNKAPNAELERDDVARRALRTRWAWAGNAGFEFRDGGELSTPWGGGVWGVVASVDAKPPSNPADYVASCGGCLFADFANANHNLHFRWDAPTPTFTAVRVGDLAVVEGTML